MPFPSAHTHPQQSSSFSCLQDWNAWKPGSLVTGLVYLANAWDCHLRRHDCKLYPLWTEIFHVYPNSSASDSPTGTRPVQIRFGILAILESWQIVLVDCQDSKPNLFQTKSQRGDSSADFGIKVTSKSGLNTQHYRSAIPRNNHPGTQTLFGLCKT